MPIATKKTLKDVRVKIMVWGEAGSGKSRFALTAPKPLVIDLEGSTNLYVDEFDMYHAEVDITNKDLSTPALLTHAVLEEIKNGTYKDIETIIIDPITDLLESIESHAAIEFETSLTGKQKGMKITDLNQLQKTKWYSYRRKRIRKVLDTIKNLPYNIIWLAREKNEWGTVNGQMQPTGKTFDGLDLIEYLPDIVIHLEKIKKDDVVAHVKKSRLGNLPDRLNVKSWDTIKEAISKSKKIKADKAKEKINDMPDFLAGDK